MKLASVRLAGVPTFGVMSDAGFVDLGAHFGARCPDLRALLANDLVAEARTFAANATPVAQSDLCYDPVIPNEGARMFALGWSYLDHLLETGKDAPEHPVLFSKHPQSMVGNNEPLIRPLVSERFDYEGEIVVIIGRAGRKIPVASAAEHIAGYSIAVDGSIRDYQQHSITAGKNFDASSAYGPWLVTPDEIPDPKQMELVTRLNGSEMQRTFFGMLAWEVPVLINYISTITRLEPGDSISTGTPAGVGHKRKPPVFMKNGDVLDIAVSGIGTLHNPVRDEA
jgi:2-keto-4-pentenoate hydratase/2-oxohepta-3-ene-1,7-dioic acid hydratase in catechol pathway